MTSRRSLLAGLGTIGLAGVAGCSSLPFGDDETDEQSADTLAPDAIGPIEWPDSPFPVAVPSTVAAAHRERARELLGAVPADPSIPNAAVADELRSERERAAGSVEADVDEPWPTEELSGWRSRRNDAATVLGAYRAATGEDDATALAERRRAVREELGAFAAAQEYRASSTLEAVLVYAPIEELLAETRRLVRPNPGYPTDPIAHPFRAGDAVGRVELAGATLADARHLRDAYLSARPDASGRWATLIAASDRQQVAVGVTRSPVGDVLDRDEPPFDVDLEGTVAGPLFRQASRRAATMIETHRESHDDGDYATAVIEAGRALAAIETLRTTVEEIRDGSFREGASADSVARAEERTRASIDAIDERGDGRLGTHLVRPGLETVDSLPDRIENGYVDPLRVRAELAWVDGYARAVRAASEFVSDRLG